MRKVINIDPYKDNGELKKFSAVFLELQKSFNYKTLDKDIKITIERKPIEDFDLSIENPIAKLVREITKEGEHA